MRRTHLFFAASLPLLALLTGWSCERAETPPPSSGRECLDAFGMGIRHGERSYFAIEGLLDQGEGWSTEARDCVMRRPPSSGGLPSDQIPENYCTCAVTECAAPVWECTSVCRDNACRQPGCEDWQCCMDDNCTQCRQQGEDGRQFVGRGCTEEQASRRAQDAGGTAGCALTQVPENSCRRL